MSRKSQRQFWRQVGVSLIALFLLISQSWAFTVTTFSPQGQVEKDVAQIRVTFSEAMVRFGERSFPSPLNFSCALEGDGRWIDERTWVFDFKKGLEANQACRATVKSGLKSIKGSALEDNKYYTFFSGPPKIVQTWPASYEDVEEDQAFVLEYNSRLAGIRPTVFFQIEGFPERFPALPVIGKEREAILKALNLESKSTKIEIVRATRVFPAGKKIQLLAGGDTKQWQKVRFSVRPSFKATFTCTREQANKPCLAIKPIYLEFSAPVSRQMVEKIRLRTPLGERKPVFPQGTDPEGVWRVEFPSPFPFLSELTLSLPANFKDVSGRQLLNEKSFPLKLKTADAPALAKFAAAPFGIIEWGKEAFVPLTVRHVEMDLPIRGVEVGVESLTVKKDQDIIYWLMKVNEYHETKIEQKVKDKTQLVETRRLSLLKAQPGVKKLQLPTFAPQDKVRPFEVVGIPIKTPGLHVLEVESRLLGKALLGEDRPMYVRTAVLVTNLAVHLKEGRDNAAVWVTTLDKAQPVLDAQITLYDCQGKFLWEGKTDQNGVARINQALLSQSCAFADKGLGGVIAIARKKDPSGKEDVSFVLSSWNQGIESWRFPVANYFDAKPALLAHTVFDRTLFRAGETVSMKHFLRRNTLAGLRFVASNELPTEVRIIHNGSDQEYRFPLNWRQNRYAETRFTLPKDARLGSYSVMLEKIGSRQTDEQGANVGEDGVSVESGGFRVEAFRLPFMLGQWTGAQKAAFGKEKFSMHLAMGYSAGGPAKALPIEVNAMLQSYHSAPPSEYKAFNFEPPEIDRKHPTLSLAGKVILDKAQLILDKNGKTQIDFTFPAIDRPYYLVTEANYRDPNGEIQTLSKSTPVWPSSLQIGIAVDDWVSTGKGMTVKSVVLDIHNKPVANQTVHIKGIHQTYLSTRKRLVGGFYAYDTNKVTEEMGTLCTAKTDARGFAFCDITLPKGGSVGLIAETVDTKKRKTQAAQSVWVRDENEVWFDLDNNDRIDILPEKPEYKPGEKARFQVRMPYRHARAWVAIEREGIVETQVIELNGKNPNFEITIKPEWAPNVFVSVLAVRGRIREVPWYSFFTWGWKTPVEWWNAYWNKNQEDQAPPTALVDLGKPSFKYGLAEIKVNDSAQRLQVSVKTDKDTYSIRKTADVEIQVKSPDGKPAPAGTEVAFAAVDEALLELMPNKSWKLLEAMLERHHYGVETSTAQLQVVGKRHFGRKAMEPGGGGGEVPTRELFDTLLLWQPKVILDAQGKARLKVPFNDSLTKFRFVAIADVGATYFGTGSTEVQVTQDVQLVSGLPMVVREGDKLKASVTVRNGTKRTMDLTVQAQATGLVKLNSQQVRLPSGMAQEVSWLITIPKGINTLSWQFEASEREGKKSADLLRVAQTVEKVVPITTEQASLYEVVGKLTIPVGLSKEALPGEGALNIYLQSKLTGEMPALKTWWESYPYTCLEQRLSKALGLKDRASWDKVMQELDRYLDEDGLATYFPIQEGEYRSGSDSLTAYILAVANEASWPIPKVSQEKMLRGLMMFTIGRIKRDFWYGENDLTERKLAALDALSRYGNISSAAWGALEIQPRNWSTNMLIDWLSLLQRVSVADRAQKIQEAEKLIRSKMIYQGTFLQFVDEKAQNRWWLMGNADVNTARLFLAVSRLPSWKADLPRLIRGLIARQQKGVWYTTNANIWGELAVRRFEQQFEKGAAKGETKVTLGRNQKLVSWANQPTSISFSWPKTGKETLTLEQKVGKPWAIVEAKMAIPLKQEKFAGYRIKKTITPVQQRQTQVYSRGDVVRVKLEIEARTNMGWVVVNDPIPAGAVILGSGLGRDSQIYLQEQNLPKRAWPSYIERGFSNYQAYYQYVPSGSFTVEYTLRINQVGTFELPPTRVEALYAPEVFGAVPNKVFKVVDDK